MRYATPVAAFFGLVLLLAVGLRLDPRHVPSPLIGKPLPDFSLPKLMRVDTMLSANDLRGRPILLNVWASWCSSCRVEHPLLVELARAGTAEIVGLNYKDTREEAHAWLSDHGNPYSQSIFDAAGDLGLDLGVYGVPETFVIDQHGIIRHKHIGPLTEAALNESVLPALRGENNDS